MTVPEPRDPTLRDCLDQLRAATGDARDLIAGLTDAQLGWRPGPGRWSVAECLAHLAATAEAYDPRLEAAARRGREAGRTAPSPAAYRPGRIGRWLVGSMEPPPKRRLRAPRAFATGERPPASAPGRFFRAQEALEARIHEADGLDLGRVRLASPVTSLLRLPLGTMLLFLLAHERRHLWQARRVREADGFPAG